MQSINNEKMIKTLFKMNTLLKLSCFSLIVIANVACVSQSTYETVLNKYNSTVKERDALIGNNQMLRNQIEDVESQKASLGDQLNLTNSQLSEKSKELGQREQALSSINSQLQDTNSQLESTNAKLNQTSSELSARDQALESTNQELMAKKAALEATKEELKKASEYVKRTHQLYDNLVGELKTELKANQVKIEQMKDGINVNLSEEILFPSGSATLNKSGRAVISKVSSQLNDKPYQFVVAGFTDNIAIRGNLAKKFPTNWELAGARSASVVRLMHKSGIKSTQLVSVSYGDNNPVASNDTDAGRAQNRRIEIRLRPLKK